MGHSLSKATPEEIATFYSDPNWIHFCGPVQPPRVGFTLFCGILEHKYFSPSTAKNDDYKMLITRMGDTIWIVLSIPKEYMLQAKTIAEIVGLRLVHKIPVLEKTGGAHFLYNIPLSQCDTFREEEGDHEIFHIQTNTIYAIENAKGHKTYDNANIKELLAQEHKLFMAIINNEKSIDLDDIREMWQKKKRKGTK